MSEDETAATTSAGAKSARATSAGATSAGATSAAHAATTPTQAQRTASGSDDVVVRRSTRRRRSVTAFREGGRTVVVIPATLTKREEAEWVGRMLERMAARTRPRLSDRDLAERAAWLSDRYLAGRARPTSVRWVSNQNTRWGSCTQLDGTIRISDRVRDMPEWVVDSVLVHELAHLLERGHGARFQELLRGFPHTDRATGFLEGVAHAWDVAAREGTPR